MHLSYIEHRRNHHRLQSSNSRRSITQFKKEFHARIPREVRDMVYNDLLDEDSMRKLCWIHFHYEYTRPEHARARVAENFPWVLQLGEASFVVAAEIIHRFYSRCQELGSDLDNISTFLHRGLFGYGVTASQVAIRNYSVYIEVQNGHSHLELFDMYSRDLLRQKWAKGFELLIYIEYYPSGELEARDYVYQLYWEIFQALNPIASFTMSRNTTFNLQFSLYDNRIQLHKWRDLSDFVIYHQKRMGIKVGKAVVSLLISLSHVGYFV